MKRAEQEKLDEALINAAREGKLAKLRALVASGAKIDASGSIGVKPICWAVMSGHLAVVKYLLRRGADIEEPLKKGTMVIQAFGSMSGMRPVHFAVKHLPVLKFLIQKGADTAAVDDFGTTLLHFAAEGGHLPVAEFLLETGCRMDIANIYGWQPLHVAVSKGHLPVVELLLYAGADADTVDNAGRTPLVLAEKTPEILALLKKWSAPEFQEKRRRKVQAEAIHAHWKRVKKHLPSAPKPSL